jgi:SAM-dependent methyltransferase
MRSGQQCDPDDHGRIADACHLSLKSRWSLAEGQEEKGRNVFTSVLPTIIFSLVLLFAGNLQQAATPEKEPAHTPDVVYVGTPYDIVSRMLKIAAVSKQDLVYDLGCGDGRMVVLAAKKYGCRGIGYDIDPERVSAALENVKRNDVGQLVKIVQADLFTLDFREADVLSLYLLPEINRKLIPQFEKLKPGSRLVFHDYGLEGYAADQTVRITSTEDNAGHTIYLYTIPLKKQ